MGRFGVFLEQHCVPEWSSRYVDYRRCQALLTTVMDAHLKARQPLAAALMDDAAGPARASSDESLMSRAVVVPVTSAPPPTDMLSALPGEYLAVPVASSYFSLVHSELVKASTFFTSETIFYEGQFEVWLKQSNQLYDLRHQLNPASISNRRKRMQDAARDLHHALELLQNFAVMNLATCAKTLGAHDKAFSVLPPLPSSPAYSSLRTSVEILTPLAENMFAESQQRLNTLFNSLRSAFQADIQRWKSHVSPTSASVSASNRIAEALDEEDQAPIKPDILRKVTVTMPQHEAVAAVESDSESSSDSDDADNILDTQSDAQLLEEADLRLKYKHVTRSTTFFIGLSIGLVSAASTLLAVLLNLQTSASQIPRFLAAFPVFRGLTIFLFEVWMWGVVLYICQRTRINHILIMDADARTALKAEHVFFFAGFATLALVCSIALFTAMVIYTPEVQNTGIIHLVLFVGMLCVIFTPFNMFFRPTRKYVMQTLWNNLQAPFGLVQFHHFFIADVFTSLVQPMKDMVYSVCFYTTGDFLLNSSSMCTTDLTVISFQYIVTLAPTLTRLLQCARRYFDDPVKQHAQLINIGKYAMSLLATGINLAAARTSDSDLKNQIVIAWAVFAGCAAMYSFLWDTSMDWGLFKCNSAAFPLRDTLLFPRFVYYVAALVNLALRLLWILNISPTAFGLNWPPSFLLLGTGLLEVFRRNLWAIMRLEHEHLVNVEHYRIVQSVPLLFPDLSPLLRASSMTFEAVHSGLGLQLDRVKLPPPAAANSTEPSHSSVITPSPVRASLHLAKKPSVNEHDKAAMGLLDEAQNSADVEALNEILSRMRARKASLQHHEPTGAYTAGSSDSD